MASKENATVLMVDVHQLATVIRTNRLDNVLIVFAAFEKKGILLIKEFCGLTGVDCRQPVVS
jgi:hypothetical protein